MKNREFVHGQPIFLTYDWQTGQWIVQGKPFEVVRPGATIYSAVITNCNETKEMK